MLTETDSVVSWIPFIVLVVVLIAVGLFITYARRRKKQGKRLFSNKMRKPDISDGADATDVPEKLDRLPKVPKWRQQPQPQSHPVITPQPQAEVESQPEIKPVNDMFKPINNSANQEPTVLKPHIQPEPTMKPQQSTDLSQIRPEDNQTKRTNKPNSLIQ